MRIARRLVYGQPDQLSREWRLPALSRAVAARWMRSSEHREGVQRRPGAVLDGSGAPTKKNVQNNSRDGFDSRAVTRRPGERRGERDDRRIESWRAAEQAPSSG
jgi:hypothetical protein